GNVPGVARSGITLWLADPRTRAQRVEEVLDADPSSVAISESGVWAVVCQRRTDLLDRFLTGTPPRGRFLAAGVRWVPLYSRGTGRWLPGQQAAYAGLLGGVAADAGAKVYERTAAITAAAPLGDAGRDVVIALVCRHPDQDTAKEAWRTTEAWAGWLPDIAALITGQLTDLNDQILWGLAIRPLLTLVTSGQHGAVLGDIMVRLADLDRDRSGIDDPGHDRPARRRLDSIVESAEMRVLASRRDWPPLAEAGRFLAAKADCARQAATLLVFAVDPGPDRGQRLAAELTAVCDLLDGAPATAAQVAQVLARHVANGRGDMDTLNTAIAALASDPRPCAGLLATSLAAQGGRFGWPAQWRAQVHRLRTHPLPDVRAAALEIDMSAR
ncbi:MAG: hypothetical protein ACRDN0_21010, partial [Trebonia sp.]